jgi:hypothetical protein
LAARAQSRQNSLIPALYPGPFHVTLRSAIQRSGLTLDRLRTHLARRGIWVGLSSLSDWQSGRSLPVHPNSLRAVAALEEILGLAPDSLAALTVDHRVADIGAVAELLEFLPGSRDRRVELISVHNRITVDARGSATTWTRTAIRAMRDGVDRYVVRYYGNPGSVPTLVRPRALSDCRLGRIVAHPREPALIYELLFDQTLRAGDTWVFEAGLVDRTGVRCTEFAYGFRFPAEQYLLEVRFDPRALPASCYSFAQRDLADERHPTGALELSAHHSVHLVASGVRSGVLGIKWDWPS